MPIQVRFDSRYQSIRVVESYDDLLYEEDDYGIVADGGDVDAEGFDSELIRLTDDVDDTHILDE